MFQPASHAADQSLKNYVLAIYALQAASLVFGLTYFIAPLIIYWKRKEAEGSWMESHLRWQFNSFWYSLPWLAVGLVTLGVTVGVGILAITGVWFIYRIGYGWTRFSRGQPIVDGKTA